MTAKSAAPAQLLDVRNYIKEIGRGQKGARDLTRADAQILFTAVLEGQVSDLQLGALLIALRVKGESQEELAGFLAACEASYAHLDAPAGMFPVVIPSYNGARKLPNLVPLLAQRLARAGVPVLVHGVVSDSGRVTTLEVFRALGVEPSVSAQDAALRLARDKLAFMPLEALAPKLARLIELRWQLGVRSSGHTLVKMLNPFRGAALRLVSVTHPDYLARMREFFCAMPEADVLLLRGAEGEAVAHPRRRPEIVRLHRGGAETWMPGSEAHNADAGGAAVSPDLEKEETGEREEREEREAAREAEPTARWIEAALAGGVPTPPPIEFQIVCCLRALEAMQAG